MSLTWCALFTRGQLREAVDALGMDSDAILRHATPRIFYACKPHHGAAEELLGLRRPTSSKGPSVRSIAAARRKRWLLGRIQQPELLNRVAELGYDAIWAQFDGFLSPGRSVSEGISPREGEPVLQADRLAEG